MSQEAESTSESSGVDALPLDASDAREERQSNTGRTAAWALIGTVVGAIANFAMLLVVDAAYGQTAFGVFSAVTAVFIVTSDFFRLGSDVGATYHIGRLAPGERVNHLSSLLRVAATPSAVSTVVVGLSVFLAADWIGERLADPDEVDDYVAMLRIVALALPISVVGNVMLAATRGFGSMKPTVVAHNFGTQVGRLLTVGVAAVVSDSVQVLAIAWVAPLLILFFYSAWWLWRVHRRQATEHRSTEWSPFWRYSSPQAATALVHGGLEKADIIMLNRMVGADETAVYALANRFIHVVVLLRYAINLSHSETFARGFARQDPVSVNVMAAKASSWAAILCAPALLLFAFFPESLLGLVGSEYTDGAAALRILSIAVAVGLVLGPADALLMMSGASRRVLAHNFSALVINIALNLLLIPEYGASGAAIAWATSIITTRSLSFFVLRRRHGVAATGTKLTTALGVSVASMGATAFFASVVWGDTLTGFATAAVCGSLLWLMSVSTLNRILELSELTSGLRTRTEG